MKPSYSSKRVHELLTPDRGLSHVLAFESEQYHQLTNKAMYRRFVPFDGDYPSDVTPAPFWSRKAGTECMVQESHVAEDQRQWRAVLAKHRLIALLRDEARISDDLRATLIQLVASEDRVAWRAAVEIIGRLGL
ncbi:MAG: hypothetical protein WBA12_01540 [Catalinimonas sp.]